VREQTIDVVIIGAGTAGLNARREVEKAGKSWVIVEGGPYGTTCARVGCMPSKLLIAAADAAWEAQHAGTFGVDVPEVRIDGRAVLARVTSERDRFAGFVVAATEAIPEANRVRGYARFEDPHTLVVDDHTRLHAGAVVVATGSSPWVPPPLDTLGDRVLVNDDVFEWDDLPPSVAVFGTGIIGLELGQALHRLGVRVTFFNPFDELGPFSDPAVADEARAVLGSELDLQLGVSVDGVEPHGPHGVRVAWTDSDGVARDAVYDRVLAAAGRRANLARLDLEHAGIELDDRGRPTVDPHTGQAGDTHVFFAGDVSGFRPLLHEASDEGRIAGFNAARFPDVASEERRVPLAVAFTDPQMAIVGPRFADLDPATTAFGEVSYADQGRARVIGRNQGLVRIYADTETCRLVGAEMFGPRVEHTAHLLAWAVGLGVTVNAALKLPFYHPVLEEGLRTALRDLAAKLRTTRRCSPCEMATAPPGT
jgi:dihydrolipoamide dehydrogenase